MPYHLATPLYLPRRKGKGRSRSSRPLRLIGLGWVKGLEPSTPGTTIRCSNQLSYTHHIADCSQIGSQNRGPSPCQRTIQLERIRGEYRGGLRHNVQNKIAPTGTPEGTRTPDPLLRRQLLYPPELQARMERVMGIEPTRPAWKAGILPLNYTRIEGAVLPRQP